MNEQRLYVDGHLVDIDSKTKITLNIKSNLLRDVSKMASNSSYTVKLPKTVRNQAIFGHSDMIQAGGDFPVRNHTVCYIYRGVEIIHNGSGVLLSSGEFYEMTFVWGLYDELKALLNDDLKLSDLQTSVKVLFNQSEQVDTYATAQAQNIFYALADYIVHQEKEEYFIYEGGGIKQVENTTNITNPVVKVSWLLELIRQQMGIEFQWDSVDAQSLISSLVIPLIKNIPNESTYTDSVNVGFSSVTGNNFIPLSVAENNLIRIATGSSGVACRIIAKIDLLLHLEMNLTTHLAATWTDMPGEHKKALLTHGIQVLKFNDPSDDSQSAIYEVDNQKYWVSNFWFKDNSMLYEKGDDFVTSFKVSMNIKLNEGESIALNQVVDCFVDFMTTPQYPYCNMSGSIKASIGTVGDKVPAGGYYPVEGNLPEIKVIDFVKFLTAITGTFPLQSSENGLVRFVPLDIIWDNLDDAIDWTFKVLGARSDNKPKTLEYKLSEYAQNNRYQWKGSDDDGGVSEFDGNLFIDDETLDVERTVMMFPFAATVKQNIPLYEIGDEGKVSHKGTSDRIMRVMDVGGDSHLVFDLNMQDIIDDKYAKLTNSLQHTKLIKEKMMLSMLDIVGFDETKPVWLGQYGAYFAVTEIKLNDNGLSDVTLLRIKID